MTKQIGSITIDETFYPGQDLYCDGAIENEILNIAKQSRKKDFRRVIEERKNWPILYHLSPQRENIVSWIPMEQDAKVLEVGSGCGAITGALSARAKEVTCIDLSKKRSLINAYRHPDCNNVTIKLGNFQDIEPHLDTDYDYIYLIGVFEYAQSYIGGEAPFHTFLQILLRHLKAGGRLVMAIENKYGLKYWAGCREDHVGEHFAGLEGYPSGGAARTFSRGSLCSIFQDCGVEEYSFYYPYPDYKFMTTLYSDRRLPMRGELTNNMRNFDRDRLLLFDEKRVFDNLIADGLFPEFSNSFLVVIGKDFPIDYVKFSNDRAPKYAVRTQIEDCVGKRIVRKYPLTEEAAGHIRGIYENYGKLAQEYAGSELAINHCTLNGNVVELEYVTGRTLEDLLDEALYRGDNRRFEELFLKYYNLIDFPKKPTVFDYDLIFSNIIVDDIKWTAIDYEWTSTKRLSAKNMASRALYCYSLGSEKRRDIAFDMMKLHLGLTYEQIGDLMQREAIFQKMSTGDGLSMTEIRNAIGYPIVPGLHIMHRYLHEEHRNRVQIYEDHGAGFNEEQSYFALKGYTEKEPFTVKAEFAPDVTAIRLDPALDRCIVQLHELHVGKKQLDMPSGRIMLNGVLISEDTAVFNTKDPNITINVKGLGAEGGKKQTIEATLSVVRISEEMAESMTHDRKEKGAGFLSRWLAR
ncbi:MAG: class I SAM-dependent methyltransferase [Lachnospiraceae bacterium]|nr:class I SAM-dependent methyltransferase [Lachnospiraceae bacterium]